MSQTLKPTSPCGISASKARSRVPWRCFQANSLETSPQMPDLGPNVARNLTWSEVSRDWLTVSVGDPSISFTYVLALPSPKEVRPELR